MHSPFHAVARGLRVVNVGFLLTAWAAGSASGLYFVFDRMYWYRDDETKWLFFTVFFGSIAAAVAGLVVGFIGRVKCLKTPAEFTAVRGRALAAVVLESSGWVSLIVGIVTMILMSYRVLPRYEWVPGIGMLLSGLMLLGGRILFLRFLRVLARVMEDDTSGKRARFSLFVFLSGWVAVLIGFGIAAGGSVLSIYQMTNPIAYLVWIAAGMGGAAGLILYDRLLSGLARTVQQVAHDADKEEMEEELAYRANTRPLDDADDTAHDDEA